MIDIAKGDPVEAGAIGTIFGLERSSDDPLFIGAVKSNIGHLEGASGIAGVLKTILVLEKGVIPPNIGFERPNPKILVDDWNIKVYSPFLSQYIVLPFSNFCLVPRRANPLA